MSKVIFVTFNFYWRKHAVSVGKPSAYQSPNCLHFPMLLYDMCISFYIMLLVLILNTGAITYNLFLSQAYQ